MMPFQMPQVIDCTMVDCAYNDNNMCHAMAINVEEGSPCAVCHTFTKFKQKAGVMDMTGTVGACKMDDCKYNNLLECTAPGGIHVAAHGPHADCRTFAKQ